MWFPDTATWKSGLCLVEEYERSWEQNEELGLNDMDTSAGDAAYDSANVETDEKKTDDAWFC